MPFAECSGCLSTELICGVGLTCDVTADGSTEGPQGDTDKSPCGANDSTDIWYCVTVNCASGIQQLEFSTCNPQTDFDTTLSVFTGSCDNLVLQGCNDDTTAPGCELPPFGNVRSSVVLPAGAPEGVYTFESPEWRCSPARSG